MTSAEALQKKLVIPAVAALFFGALWAIMVGDEVPVVHDNGRPIYWPGRGGPETSDGNFGEQGGAEKPQTELSDDRPPRPGNGGGGEHDDDYDWRSDE